MESAKKSISISNPSQISMSEYRRRLRPKKSHPSTSSEQTIIDTNENNESSPFVSPKSKTQISVVKTTTNRRSLSLSNKNRVKNGNVPVNGTKRHSEPINIAKSEQNESTVTVKRIRRELVKADKADKNKLPDTKINTHKSRLTKKIADEPENLKTNVQNNLNDLHINESLENTKGARRSESAQSKKNKNNKTVENTKRSRRSEPAQSEKNKTIANTKRGRRSETLNSQKNELGKNSKSKLPSKVNTKIERDMKFVKKLTPTKTVNNTEKPSTSKIPALLLNNSDSSVNNVTVNKNIDNLSVEELLAMGEGSSDVKTYEFGENVSSESVEITLALPKVGPIKRSCNRQDELEIIMKRRFNNIKKDNQMNIHKVHFLCLLANGMFLNNLLNSQELFSIALSCVPNKNFYPPKHSDMPYLEKLVKWFCGKMNKNFQEMNDCYNFEERIQKQFETKEVHCHDDFVYCFILIARVLGLQCRLIKSLQPITFKVKLSELAPISRKNSKDTNDNEGETSDDDFEVVMEKPSEGKNKLKLLSSLDRKKKNDRRVLSTDSDSDLEVKMKKDKSKKTKKSRDSSKTDVKKKKTVDTWCEIYLEAEELWVSIDIQDGTIMNDSKIYSKCTQPSIYIIAWNNDNTVKDVTIRYAPTNKYVTTIQKSRVCSRWLKKTLSYWRPPKSIRDNKETKLFDEMLKNTPLPTSISDYKDHPNFILKRHLLKFEAIYPSDAPPLGFIKNEPVFSRDCVFDLHSRDTWIKQAKQIKLNESAYKIVKARPKYNRSTGGTDKDLPLELFGHWQTEDYKAEPAVDGKVPRNTYGNVDLYKLCMLPPGTCYLQLPGINRIARKLNIDCAAALVGWDYHSGGSHPVFDGFIICEEFKDIVMDTFHKEFEESNKKEAEKSKKRAKKNWRKLYNLIIIGKRLKSRHSRD